MEGTPPYRTRCLGFELMPKEASTRHPEPGQCRQDPHFLLQEIYLSAAGLSVARSVYFCLFVYRSI